LLFIYFKMLSGSNDHEKLLELCGKSFKEQAVWFLNAYWGKYGESEAENLWRAVELCNECDINNNGVLDELESHVFLEKSKEEMTVMAMRKALRESGAIEQSERPKTVPLTHYLLFKYGIDWHTLVNAAQGDNQEEIEKAQRLLESAQAAVEEARQREKEAKHAEAESKAAQRELEAALAELQAEEDAYNSRTAELKRKSEEGGVVSKNKAKNELAQHLAADPLPLRRAKINQEAAVKKAERATATAIEARAAAEAALAEATRQLEEAQAYLDEVKSRGGSGQGILWWMERELHEAKAYMPQKQGGYRK